MVLAPLADGSGKRGLARIVDAQFLCFTTPAFRYYITYEGENRRMDRWIGQEHLCSDPEKVAKASRKREKSLRRQEAEQASKAASYPSAAVTGLFENDEHKGMEKR